MYYAPPNLKTWLWACTAIILSSACRFSCSTNPLFPCQETGWGRLSKIILASAIVVQAGGKNWPKRFLGSAAIQLAAQAYRFISLFALCDAQRGDLCRTALIKLATYFLNVYMYTSLGTYAGNYQSIWVQALCFFRLRNFWICYPAWQKNKFFSLGIRTKNSSKN